MRKIPAQLMDREFFSRKEYIHAMTTEYGLTIPQIDYDLRKRIADGTVTRIGNNQYAVCVNQRRQVYFHTYSQSAMEIVQVIHQHYDDLDFQVFELTQLNDFMNHLVAHNTIFVFVENDLVDHVFATLRQVFSGRVLLKPSEQEYYRYLQDDEIIVCRLPSETPKGYKQPWQSKLEKILVDISTDKLISRIVPNGEKREIYTGAFSDYYIDTDIMLRYARRKGADKKMQQVLNEYSGEAEQ